VPAPARRGAVAAMAVAALACCAVPAWGAFAASSTIGWNAVTPPTGDSVVYVVTAPGGGTTTTSATSYQLPSVNLMTGKYAVQAQISSGWRSQATTITVSFGLLGLYVCSTP